MPSETVPGTIQPDDRTQIRAVEDTAYAAVERLHLEKHRELAEAADCEIICAGRMHCRYFMEACNKVKHALARLV